MGCDRECAEKEKRERERERERERGRKKKKEKKETRDSEAVAVTPGNWRNFAEGELVAVIKSGWFAVPAWTSPLEFPFSSRRESGRGEPPDPSNAPNSNELDGCGNPADDEIMRSRSGERKNAPATSSVPIGRKNKRADRPKTICLMLVRLSRYRLDPIRRLSRLYARDPRPAESKKGIIPRVISPDLHLKENV